MSAYSIAPEHGLSVALDVAKAVPGFVNEYTLVGDDGVSLASCVVFESKEAYMALANDPEQDRWWQDRVVPLLDGEVRWIDGTWAG